MDISSYVALVQQWRQEREAELAAADGWLSLAGLFLLGDGCRYTIGSAPGNDIVLPPSAPAHLGELLFADSAAHLAVAAGQPVRIDGEALPGARLVDNTGGRQPTLVTAGSVTFFIHHFGDEYAVRVKDSANPAIGAFAGRRWYAVKPEYRAAGRFTPFAAEQSIPIGTVANTATIYRAVGVVDFTLGGCPLRLLAATGRSPDALWIVLRDATAKDETYGAARFLHPTVDAAGNVDLDFNRAVNPPCAFTPYATCPLPPPENILGVRVEAGELRPPA
jgi:uncharacterized protein (DUF1684 family)